LGEWVEGYGIAGRDVHRRPWDRGSRISDGDVDVVVVVVVVVGVAWTFPASR
jgi:hypothetical protein